MQTRRSAKSANKAPPPAAEIKEENDDDDAETLSAESDFSPPARKRVKPSAQPKRKRASPTKKGALTKLLETSVKENKAISGALQNDTPLEDDERVDVVVQEIRREGHLASLRCGVLNQEQRLDRNVLINTQSNGRNVPVAVGRRLTICAPWHEIKLEDGSDAWICPFVLPRPS